MEYETNVMGKPADNEIVDWDEYGEETTEDNSLMLWDLEDRIYEEWRDINETTENSQQ
ncbi:MAG: hypothetical protein H8E17_21050 [Deltaproteobacteria bacterium]|nr:hypothetical protein [Deltaproteobacteria bacterium]